MQWCMLGGLFVADYDEITEHTFACIRTGLFFNSESIYGSELWGWKRIHVFEGYCESWVGKGTSNQGVKERSSV